MNPSVGLLFLIPGGVGMTVLLNALASRFALIAIRHGGDNAAPLRIEGQPVGPADSPAREIDFNGLYLVQNGRVKLLDSDRDRSGEVPTASRCLPIRLNPAGPGEVWIVSPEGKHLGTLELPQLTAGRRPRICAT